MKRLYILLGIVILLTSCDKLKQLASASFNFDNTTAEFTILPTNSTTSFSKSETFYMNLDSLIKANNAELAVNYLKTLTINSIEMTVLNPDTANNFANISSCTVSVSSNVNTTPIQIGSLASNPDVYTATLSIPVNQSVDIKEYAKTASTFNYTITGNLRRPVTKDVKCKIKVNYKVTAGL